MDNNLAFKFYKKLIRSNFRNYRVKCVTMNVQFAILYVCNDEYNKLQTTIFHRNTIVFLLVCFK